jgi:hypothetical protein
MNKRKASEEINSKEKDKFRQTTLNILDSDASKTAHRRSDEFESLKDVGLQFLEMADNQLSSPHELANTEQSVLSLLKTHSESCISLIEKYTKHKKLPSHAVTKKKSDPNVTPTKYKSAIQIKEKEKLTVYNKLISSLTTDEVISKTDMIQMVSNIKSKTSQFNFETMLLNQNQAIQTVADSANQTSALLTSCFHRVDLISSIESLQADTILALKLNYYLLGREVYRFIYNISKNTKQSFEENEFPGLLENRVRFHTPFFKHAKQFNANLRSKQIYDSFKKRIETATKYFQIASIAGIRTLFSSTEMLQPSRLKDLNRATLNDNLRQMVESGSFPVFNVDIDEIISGALGYEMPKQPLTPQLPKQINYPAITYANSIPNSPTIFEVTHITEYRSYTNENNLCYVSALLNCMASLMDFVPELVSTLRDTNSILYQTLSSLKAARNAVLQGLDPSHFNKICVHDLAQWIFKKALFNPGGFGNPMRVCEALFNLNDFFKYVVESNWKCTKHGDQTVFNSNYIFELTYVPEQNEVLNITKVLADSLQIKKKKRCNFEECNIHCEVTKRVTMWPKILAIETRANIRK